MKKISATSTEGTKLCVTCEHFVFESIGVGPDYSEMTGGDPYGGMSCGKRHFYEERPYDTKDFREIVVRAEKCKDYKGVV